ELSRETRMVFKITEAVARTELACGRLPAETATVRHVARVVRLRHAELAEVVVDGERVGEPRHDLAGDECARRESAAKELLRHLPIGPRPVRPRPLHRSRGQRGKNADTDDECLRCQILYVAKDQRLLRGAERPARDVVTKFRVPEKAGQPDHRAMPVDVVAWIDVAYATEMIGERLPRGHLVQVSEQSVHRDVERSARRLDDVE